MDDLSMCHCDFLMCVFSKDAGKIMQAHLLFHTKMWHGCKVCPFLINLCRLNRCIKYLPHLDDDGLMTSKDHTLSDTQLCGIMMCRYQKEWAYYYNADVGRIPTNIDALLENFETYKKLDEIKLNSTPIPRKPVAGRVGDPGSKKRSSGGRGSGRRDKKKQKPRWSEKLCKHCKEWGGPHTSHNTDECKKYNERRELVAHADGNGDKRGGGD